MDLKSYVLMQKNGQQIYPVLSQLNPGLTFTHTIFPRPILCTVSPSMYASVAHVQLSDQRLKSQPTLFNSQHKDVLMTKLYILLKFRMHKTFSPRRNFYTQE